MPGEEGEGHEHVCSACLEKYRCTNPDDADLEMGLCPDHRPEPETPKATKRKGTKR